MPDTARPAPAFSLTPEALLRQFADFLAVQQLAQKSITNYLSDVRKFLSWEIEHSGGSLEIKHLERDMHAYRAALLDQATPLATMNRHLASLRQFGAFLNTVHQMGIPLHSIKNISTHPQENQTKGEKLHQKALQQFGLALEHRGCSTSTVANYVADTSQFADFLGEISLFSDQIKPSIGKFLDSLRVNAVSAATLRRKQSSLRQFYRWAKQSNYITYDVFDSFSDKAARVVERFRPLAFFERSRGESVQPDQSQAKHFLARAYRTYSNWPASSYLHLAVLVLFVSMLGVFGYQQFFLNAEKKFAFPTSLTRPNRILSFQGRLTDTGGTPITVATNFQFRLFDDLTAGTGNVDAMWASGTCAITPDQDGIFSTLLGGSCGPEIPPEIFSENQNVFLEVQVAAETLTPRQQIATVGYALNSETLQGYPASASAVENTVPVFDNNGDMVIGLPSPAIRSTSGTFSIQGNALSFVTNTGTGGSITLAPDGAGQINLIGGTTSQDFINITNANLTTGTLIRGTVGNNNTGYNFLSFLGGSTPSEKFSVNALGAVNTVESIRTPVATISATYAGATPLIINGTGGQIFSIANNGNIAATGTITGLTGITSSGTITFSGLNTAGAVVYTNGSGTLGVTAQGSAGQVLTSGGAGTPTWTDPSSFSTNFWQLNGQVLAPGNTTWDLAIGGNSTASAAFQVFADTGNVTTDGDIEIAGGDLTTTATTFNLLNTTATTINFGGAATTMNIGPGGATAASINIAGGSAATGCTVDGATGDLTCSGAITGSATSGVQGYWQRNLQALSPTFITDDILTGGTTTASALIKLTGTAGNNSWINTGNFGIGTTIPAQALTVVGNILTSGGFATGNRAITSDAVNTGTYILENSVALSQVAGDLRLGNAAAWTSTSIYADNTPVVRVDNSTVGINTTSALAALDVRGSSGITPVASVSGQTSFAALVVDNAGVGDLFAASSSGRPIFTILNNGSVRFNQASSIDATGTLSLNTTNNQAITTGTGQITLNGNVDATNGLDVTNANLTVGGANFSVAPGTGNIITAGDLALNGGDLTSTATTFNFDIGNTGSLFFRDGTNTLFSIVDGGTQGNASSSGNLTLGGQFQLGRFTVDPTAIGPGSMYFNTSTNTIYFYNGTVWSPVGSGTGGSPWRELDGAIVPNNSTEDVLIGAQATASAKFAFMNVNSGVPTASISAGIPGATYITASGNLATTAMQTLLLGSSTTGAIQLSPAGSAAMTLRQGGSIGIGTVDPLATLDIRGNSGTTPAASVSAQTAFAAMVVDNSGLGDLFTASSSGMTRFTLTQNGDVIIPKLNTAGGVVYTNSAGMLNTTAQGTTGQILISNGAGTPTWQDPAAVSGVNFWQLNNKVLAPGNVTWDVAIGGNATGAATFQVFADTGNATTSGNLVFNSPTFADNLIAATNMSGLQIGDANTGNILFQGGNVGIGTTDPLTKLHVSGSTVATLDMTGGSGTVIQAQQSGTNTWGLVNATGGLQVTTSQTSGGTGVNIRPNAVSAVVANTPTFSVTPTVNAFTITGSYANQNFSNFAQPTITAGSALTVTNATTLSIAGAPTVAGSALATNSIGLRIDAGALTSAVTNGYGLYVDAPTGAVNNYGMVVASGNVGLGNVAPTQKLDVTGSATISANLMAGGQVQLGRFASNPTTIGEGSVIYNSTGATIYYSDGANWIQLANANSVIDGTGVANYIAKWSDANTLTTGLIYDNGTNVGINTTGPDAKLDILSTTGPQLRLTYTDGSVFTDFTANSSGDLVIGTSGNTVISSDLQISGGDILGSLGETRITLVDALNKTSISGDLDVNGSFADGTGFLTVTRTATISSMISTDTPLTLKDNVGTTIMTVANSGAITTNTTGNPLTLNNQSAQQIFQVTSAGAMTLSAPGTATNFAVASNGNITSRTGNVTSNAADSSTAVGFLLNTSNTLSTYGSKLLSVQNNGTERMYLDSSGNLFVSGTVTSGNGVSHLLTNASGGTVANRSLVVTATSANSSFTTTTTVNDVAAYGVVVGVGQGVANDADLDGVCDANDNCLIAFGGEVEVLLTNASTANRGDYIFTSTTAGSGYAAGQQFDGLIGAVTNTTGAGSGYVKMIFKVQPQVTATSALDAGSKHNEYRILAKDYTPVGDGTSPNDNIPPRGLFFDNFSDSTKTDFTNTTVGGPVQISASSGSPTPASPFRVGLVQGQTMSAATTDNASNTYLTSSVANESFYYDRTRDSTADTLVELGIDPNWYNGVTLTSASSSAAFAQFSQNTTVNSQPLNPNLSVNYNGAMLRATGNYSSNAQTIYITIKSPGTFDWSDYNGQAATGVTITPGTTQTLGTTGVSVVFTNTRYNVGDVFKIASWFVEPTGSNRGAKQQFPERSYVIATDSSVEIIDADTQKVWMRFTEGTGFYIGATTKNHPATSALNGRVYASEGDNGLELIDFVHDAGGKYQSASYLSFDKPISQRNTAQNTVSFAHLAITNNNVNDIAPAVIPNKPTQTVSVNGWGYIVGDATAAIEETVNFPYMFNNVPNVLVTSAGTATSAPSTLKSCTSPQTAAGTFEPNDITESTFLVNMAGPTFSISTFYCFTWTATGRVSPRTFVAAATDGGVAIVNESDQSVKFNAFSFDSTGTLGTSLASYWNFNEASGNASDTAGSNTLTATGTTITNGWLSYYRSFNGSSDYLSNSSPTSLPTGSSARSVAAWIIPTNVNPGGTVFSQNNTAGTSQSFEIYGPLNSAGTTYLFSDGINAGNNITLTGSEIPTAGALSHIVFTFDGTNWAYYLNGNKIKTGTFGTAINTVMNTVSVGRLLIGAQTAYYPGAIDEVGIWSKSLSDTEVKDLYNKGTGNPYKGNTTEVAIADDDMYVGGGNNYGTVTATYNIANSSSGYNYGSTIASPAISTTPNVAINSIAATPRTSTFDNASNTIYIGHDAGATVLQERQSTGKGLFSDESTSSVKYYNKSYITEEMVGDVRGMFPFTETSGSLADASLKANFLEDENPPTYSVSSVRGTGLTFDGAADYLCSDANNDGTCDVDSDYAFGAGSISISTWFKHAAAISGTDILLDRSITAAPAQGDGYRIYMNSTGTMTFGIDDDTTFGPEDTVTSAQTYNDNKWHHLVAVKSTTTSISLYIDGALASTLTPLTATGSLSDSSTILAVGAQCNSGAGANCTQAANFWDGSLDELTFGSQALTANQVKTLYQAGYRALQSHATTLGGLSADGNQKLAGAATNPNNVVKALGVDYNNQFMYVTSSEAGLSQNNGGVSKIDLNADTNVFTYTSSSTPAQLDSKINSLAVGYNLETMSSTASGAYSVPPEADFIGTSGNYIAETQTTVENFNQAMIWAQYVTDSQDISNTVTVSVSNDNGSTYSQCNLTNTDTSQSPPEYQYFCLLSAPGNQLKTKFAFARGSTKTNTYLTRYGIAWLDVNAVANSAGVQGLFTGNNSAVANGSYLEVAHNAGTNDIIAQGWVFDVGSGTWKDVSAATESGVISTSNASLAHEGTLTVTHNQNTFDVNATAWEYDASASAYKRIDEPQGVNHLVSASLPDVIRGWWKLNDASGNAVDSSRYNQTLTANGGLTYSVQGKVDAEDAITFNGTTGYFTCTYANCGGSGELNYTGSGGWSVGAWIKRSASGNLDGVLAMTDVGVANGYELSVQTSNKVQWRVQNTTGQEYAISSISTITPGQWYFVVATYDGSNEVLYVNGEAESSIAVTNGIQENSGQDFSIGAYFTSNAASNFFHGTIDEPFVYAKTLSTDEIQKLYEFGARHYKISNTNLNTTVLTNLSGSTQNVRLDVATQAYRIVQVDQNTARLYNYSGSSQNLRLDILTGTGGGGSGCDTGCVSLAPTSADVDSQANTNSIWINKTDESGRIMRLQNDGVDRFAVGWDGHATISGSLTIGTASLKLSDYGTYSLIQSNSGSLRLQAGGIGTGPTGTGNIMFLDSFGTTRGRIDTVVSNNNGTAADGTVSITAAKNINTDTIAAGRSYADGIAYKVDPATATTSGTMVKLYETPNGLSANDEVLLINLQGTVSDTTDVGNYEFLQISSINSTTKEITFSSVILNSYDGSTPTTQKVVIQRVPNYNSVTLSSSGSLTASAYDRLATVPSGTAGYLTGIVAFRAHDTVTVGNGTSISVNGKGYAGGLGGSSGSANGGANGDSFDGSQGRGGSGAGAGETKGGGRAGDSATTSPNNGFARTGGGGGGSSGSSAATPLGGGGGAGGGYGSAGGGGGGGGNNNSGAAGGSTSTSANAGGGGGGCLSGGAGGPGAGGAAGSAGSNASGCSVGNGTGGQVGSGTTGASGGGAGGANTAGGGGGGGGGTAGATTLTTMFFGGGGGGGGSHTSSAGQNGGAGGGIIYIGASTVTVGATGAITSNGATGTAASVNGGGGGGGAGGSVYIAANSTATLGTTLLTATGGSTSAVALDGGGGGAGGLGRVYVQSPTISGTTNPTATTAVSRGYATLYIGAVNTTAADLAEYYVTGDKTIDAGDVVSFSDTRVLDNGGEEVGTQGVLRKTEKPYDSKLAGIISTKPGLLLGNNDSEVGNDANRQLALSGRVPVKIDPASPPIAVGDFLTSSDKPGYATKATKTGYTVAKALESWEPITGASKIEAFVTLGYYDPALELTDTGDIQLGINPEATDSATPSATYALRDSSGNLIDRIGTFSDAVVANFRAGIAKISETFTDELTAPIANLDLLSSTASDSGIAIRLDKNLISFMNIDTEHPEATPEAVITFDNEGNATFSGEVVAESTRTQRLHAAQAELEQIRAMDAAIGNATISGTLFANNIDVNSILGIEDKVSSAVNGILSQASGSGVIVYQPPSSTMDLINSLLADNDASTSAYIAMLNQWSGSNVNETEVITPSAAVVSDFLAVQGFASFNYGEFSTAMSVRAAGQSLTMTANSFSLENTPESNNPSQSNTLYIQPSGNGSLNLLAGTLVLEESGNVALNGNLYVNGSIYAQSVQTANIDIGFEGLLTSTATDSALYSPEVYAALTQATNSAVLTIAPGVSRRDQLLALYNDQGELVSSISASGSASFADIRTKFITIAGPSGDTQGQTSGQTQSNATAGTAVLPAGQTEIVITNTAVGSNTLVYLTPLSNTQNQVLYVASKTDGQGFTVAMNQALGEDVQFNYWLIKVE